MIITSTIVLALALCGVPISEAAPIGTRNLDIRSMRRLETSQALATRNLHHSAKSYVPGGLNDRRLTDMDLPNVARDLEGATTKGWRRERAVPRYVRDVAARRRSLSAPSNVEEVKRDTIAVASVKKSEVPEIDLARKSLTPGQEQSQPIGHPKNPDGSQRRAEAAEPGITARHHDEPHLSSGNPINLGSETEEQRRDTFDMKANPSPHPRSSDDSPITGHSHPPIPNHYPVDPTNSQPENGSSKQRRSEPRRSRPVKPLGLIMHTINRSGR